MRISGRKLSVLLFLVLLAALVIRIMVLRSENEDEESFYRKGYDRWEETAVCRELPLLSFSQEDHPQTGTQLVHQFLAQAFPWYAYEKLYLTEGEKEKIHEETDGETEGKTEDKTETNAGITANLVPEIEKESREDEKGVQLEIADIKEEQEPSFADNAFEDRLQDALEDPWLAEIAGIPSQNVFAQALIDNAWWDYPYLLQNWYTVDPSTDPATLGISTPELVTYPAGIQKERDGGYEILLYHTHSLEQYKDSAQYASPNGVMGAGEFLASLLENQYGYHVLHLTQSFDAEGRDYAYGKALPVLKEVLEEHPEIQVLIDLHRDEVDSNAHLVCQTGEKQVARYMFFNGLSYTRSAGELEEFPNSYRKENLAVSYQLQLTSDALFPGCARKIYLKGYRYNMHLRPRSILIELGAQNNTEQEAWNSCVLLAKMLDTVLSYSIR